MHPAVVALVLPVSTLLRLSLTMAASDTSCAPATCGGLNITYPFSLAGVQPVYCGYPAFALTCDGGDKAYLSRTFRDNLYRVRSISYGNRSMLVAVETAFAGDGACRIPDFNVSSGLGLFPVNVSATNGDNITFVYSCKIPHSKQLTGPCAKHAVGAYISGRPGDEQSTPPPPWVQANCSSASVPVQAFQGGMNLTRDYDRLISDGFVLEWPTTLGDCDACKRRGGLCRFFELSFQCVNSSTSSRDAKKKQNLKLILIVVLSSIASLIVTCLVWIMYCQQRKEKNYESNIEEILKGYDSLVPKRYRYSELEKITGCFKDRLGEGGYGTVFKGVLEDGHMVAVKLLKGSEGNGEEFVNEVVSIRRTSHVNIVNLLGFCLHGPKRALIYEYMANGSLEKYILSEETKRAIGWEKLQEIATGIARGLEYLHRGCNARIIHFDIKPNNILLDDDFCPKIADFGLAKLCHLKDSALSMAEARGTIGFIAPELFSRGYGVVSTKSDVYSYGMMLLEMVGGRKNLTENTENSSQYFPNWVHDRLVKDLQSHEVTCKTEEIPKQITLVGLWCIQTNPENRPSMSRVIEMLEKNLDELEMSPKPLLSCPRGPSQFSSELGLFCRDSGETSLSTIFHNPTQKQMI